MSDAQCMISISFQERTSPQADAGGTKSPTTVPAGLECNMCIWIREVANVTLNVFLLIQEKYSIHFD